MQLALMSASNKAARTILKSTNILHPAIPMKYILPLPNHYVRYRQYYSSQAVVNTQKLSRQKCNLARLYARHCIEVAAAAMLTRSVVSQMENNSTIVRKPTEWQEGTEQFEARRKRFGESVGQLGSNAFTRVWAAGMFFSAHLSLSFLQIPFVLYSERLDEIFCNISNIDLMKLNISHLNQTLFKSFGTQTLTKRNQPQYD